MGLIVELHGEAWPALVVGGGSVAGRYVRTLVASGFPVTVVAPRVSTALRDREGVTVHARAFDPLDIRGHFLVFACSGSRATDRVVGHLARSAGIPVLVSGHRSESTFSLPAMHRTGQIAVAVSTGGASPVVADELRDALAAEIGAKWLARLVEERSAERTFRVRERQRADGEWE